MPRIEYVAKRFTPAHQRLIDMADRICREYAAQGFDLTLRQLYYQFVARDVIANKQTEYKRLGGIINDARLAGLLDWNYIVDRTRNLRSLAHWDAPQSIIQSAASGYRTERWADQPRRVEVWIEKDALVGVIAGACERNDVDYFSCRGYASQSELWGAAQRMTRYERAGQKPVVIHLGDHDPSGVDMTRDIRDRLALFGADVDVRRIALNMDQIEEHEPPPNPAKLTDSRATRYIHEHGRSSWELDALEPTLLDRLIEDEIEAHRDDDLWDQATQAMWREQALLEAVAGRWEDVAALVTDGGES
ncbi:hypothetical protein [Streptomyces caniscabiei]|uniref:DUF2399 domain-containing protein n=1 Tax=Streptomyces caniscabiei TaxID=2746961 RepID=A0ABU4MJ25_9ACTN|nr:hypothetical protein [Streptomyces caniscabiei]MBE4790969.1 hypothetical protein [Streptomyces caniscabiei]MDX3009596.1 hypothetical protein [Streptomyces caniscabiei]MDX3037241.1 hypothetical protein [Streptomyces caniscabiei]